MNSSRPISHISNEQRSKKVLELPANPGEMLKPKELIEIVAVKGMDQLTLFDRRVYNKLLRNAHGPDLGKPGSEFMIRLADLRGGHDSNDRIGESLTRLMQTVISLNLTKGSVMPDGSVLDENVIRRAQLLGPNNLDDPSRPAGRLVYTIDTVLALVLSQSVVFAKLELDVMQAFTSSYAFALYEQIALRSRMGYKADEEIPLKRLREQFLCVDKKKLQPYSALRRFALEPAVREINQIANFNVSYMPVKSGRKVVAVKMFWWWKTVEEQKAQYAELQRRKPPQNDMFSVLES